MLYSCFICNGPRLETTQTFFNGGTANAGSSTRGKLLITKKKKGTAHTHSNLDESPKNYAE